MRFIDAIVERTLSSRDRQGQKFTGYSPEYKKSDAFNIYGKSNRVNLKLTGEMLASLKVSKITTEGFWLEIEADQQPKAAGHIYGEGNNPVRDFWGEPNDETIKQILEGTIKDYNIEDLDVAIALQEVINQQTPETIFIEE